jgi:hypothetical protein
MDDPGQAAARLAARRDEERGRLAGLAGRIARGWADRLGVGEGAVEWVAVRGGARAPLSAGPGAAVHWLDGGAGVAFVLAAPGVADLLFVVRGRGEGYSVNISNSARPWDPGRRLGLRPDRPGDLKRLLEAAARYARGPTP